MYVYLYLQAGAVLSLGLADSAVGRAVDPDQVEVVIGVVFGVVSTELLDDVAEGLVLPAVCIMLVARMPKWRSI